MASLYSAQAAITAREQLNHQLQEKRSLDHSIQDATHKEKHNPYHYHQTVHQKCKHHGEDKESTLHKKLHDKIDQAKLVDSLSQEEGHGNPARTYKRILGECEEAEEEMRTWAKTIQACLKGEHKLNDKQLHEHHTKLYKWMLCLGDIFHQYEGTLKTQTSLHVFEQEGSSDKLIRQQKMPFSPQNEHHSKDNHSLKLPHLMSRERMEALEERVAKLEKQLESSQAANRDLSKIYKDTSAVLAEYQQKNHIFSEKTKRAENNIKNLLVDLQQFTSHLLVDLNDSEKMKQYPKIVQAKLARIRQFKNYLE